MDGHGSDGSDDNGTGRGNEWEVLSDLDSSGFAFDSDVNNGNGHGALSEGISMVSEHFNCPSLESYSPDDASAQALNALSQPVNSSALDWLEPPDSREDSKESFDGSSIGISGRIDDDHDVDDDQRHDVLEGKHVNVDLKSSLFSPSVQVVLMSTGSAQICSKNDQNLQQAHDDKGDKYDVEDDAESLAELEREIFAGSGFSSLIQSDMHGNVVRVDEKGHGIGEEEDDYLGSWWKHTALCRYWRQATTLWSLTLAAAIMGLVILGQRCQHERWKNHQLRLQLCYKDEKISQLLFQIAQLKETSSGRRRRIAVIRRNGGLQGHF